MNNTHKVPVSETEGVDPSVVPLHVFDFSPALECLWATPALVVLLPMVSTAAVSYNWK